MDVFELGALDANFLRYGLHKTLQKCPLVANREQWNAARINEKLSTPATRFQGLAILEAFLPQCSDVVFSEHAMSWMQQCLHALEAGSKSGSAPLAFNVLKMLLQMSSHFSELTKMISSSVVSKALEKIVANMDGDLVPALQCLHVLMTHYGGACGASKGLLEQALLRTVCNPKHAAQAARCWPLLSAVGGGGSQRVNYKQQWVVMQSRLCNTLHYLLARLLHQYRNLHSWDETDDRLPLPEVNEENTVTCIQKLTKQLCSVSKFLQAMLRGVFPVAKSVSLGEIIGVVCRGLAVNCFSTPNKDADQHVIVVTCMPDIHIAMLGILEALIVCCGRNLIPFGGVICDLALQELRWTSVESTQYASERPFGNVRVATCRVLATWLDISKAASLVEKHAENLVTVLLPDVQSSKPSVTLSVPAGKTKGTPKRVHTTGVAGDVLPQRSKLRDGQANSDVCAAALEALRCIVYSSATLVPAKLHKVLQEVVVTLLLDVQRSSGPEELPVPYSVPGCRLGLYRLLEALVMCPHSEQAPPMHFALAAFSLGQADQNCQVTSFCTAALSHVEKVSHPASASLQFPVGALSERPEIVPHVEISTKQLEPPSTQDNSVESSASERIYPKRAFRAEYEEIDITEVSDLEEDIEEIAVEAVPEEADDVDEDDDGLRIISEGVEKIRQLNEASNLSSFSQQIDSADTSRSQEEIDIVDEDTIVVVDGSSDSGEERKIKAKPKKRKRKAKDAKNMLRRKSSGNVANVNPSNSIETLSSVSSDEHEGESDHCWTAEEAALVSNLVKDFELGEETSTDKGSEVMTLSESQDEDDIAEIVADTAVLKTKKQETQIKRASKGTKRTKNQETSSKKFRKREASPLLIATGPENKRQKTRDVVQIPEDEECQGNMEVEELPGNHVEDDDKLVEEVLEICLEQTDKESNSTQVKEQEICDAVETRSDDCEQFQIQNKQAERDSDSSQKCPTQQKTSNRSVGILQVQQAGQGEKENDSAQKCLALLETSEGKPEQVERQNDEENSLHDSCPIHMEIGNNNPEQVQAQDDVEMEKERECMLTHSAQVATSGGKDEQENGQNSEQSNTDTNSSVVQQSHGDTDEGMHVQVNGQKEVTNQESGESGGQPEEQKASVSPTGDKVAIQEENRDEAVIPAEQRKVCPVES